MRNFDLLVPGSREEVIGMLADAGEDARLIAGGTGLVNLMKQRLASPETLISLHRVPDLAGIDWSGDAVAIGALEHLLDIQQDREVAARLPVLCKTLAEVASPRIRSMATMGGAIGHADPNQDLPVTLMAMDAVVLIESRDGFSEIPLDEFYTDYYETRLQPGQLITGIRIVLPGTSSRFCYKKFTPGSREDYACVGVCVRLDIDDNDGACRDVRIVLGSVPPVIKRARAAEEIVKSKPLTEALAREAAQSAAAESDPVDDARGSAHYKRDMSEVWVRRSLLQAAGSGAN